MSTLQSPILVQLFGTCLVEALRPKIGPCVIDVLERLGLSVLYPERQTCCGQPAFNTGAWREARAMARYTLDLLSRSPVPIILPSGSCTDMIVHHYPELFSDDVRYGPLARNVAARTYEFSQFLVDRLRVRSVPSHFDGRLAYQPSCHLLRNLGVDEQPRGLLAQVRGAEMVELPAASECCGFGGLFAIRMSGISGAMLERKLDHIEAVRPNAVVACDVSCLLQISGGLHRRHSPIEVRHIAEILAGTP